VDRRVIIRRGEASDADVAASIYLVSREAAGSAFPPNIHSAEETRAFVREVVMATREAWLATVEDRPVGLLVLDGDAIDWLHVLPEAQGQGVGSALLDHAQTLRPDGLRTARLCRGARDRRRRQRGPRTGHPLRLGQPPGALSPARPGAV
jgi:ribosomal protein S18 acetylase RimI-like enzyme